MELVGVSTYDAAGTPASEEAGAAPDEAFFTSASVICPPVPVPFKPVILIPVSMANRTAAALAFGCLSIAGCNFPPLDSVSSGAGADCSFAGGAVPELVDGGSEDWLASSFGGAGAAFSPPASSSVKDSKADASAPSSIIMAMGFQKVSKVDLADSIEQSNTHIANCNILLS
jgi:hypothetical protein